MAAGESSSKAPRRDSAPTSARLAAARQLRSVIDAVDRGDLTAEGGVAKRLLRRLEGALAVLETEEGKRACWMPGRLRIIARKREAGWSLAKIADHLRAKGTPTTRGGSRWYASTVQAALRSLELDRPKG